MPNDDDLMHMDAHPAGERAPLASAPPPFAPATPWARWTVILLVATIVLEVVAVFSDLAEIGLLARIARGDFTEAEALANDGRQAAIGGLQILLLVATGVVFLVWLHHACRNLTALGARELRFSPGWAVGWFFVPVMSLVRPYQVVKEVWTASDPEVAVSDAAARDRAQPMPLLGWWWGMWIVTDGLGMVGGNLRLTGETAGDLTVSSSMLLAADLTAAAAAVLAISIVLGIDAPAGQGWPCPGRGGAGRPRR